MKITICDFDGTVSPFVPDPKDSFVHPDFNKFIIPYLEEGNIFIFLTGRDPRFIFEALDPKYRGQISIFGNHGISSVDAVGNLVLDEAFQKYLAATTVLENCLIESLQGIRYNGPSIIENKTLGAIVHLRRLDDETKQEVIAKTTKLVEQYPELFEDFELGFSDGIIELKPRVDHDKGHALTKILSSFEIAEIDYISYCGDDLPDLPAFEAAKKIRNDNNIPGYNFMVVREGSALAEVLDVVTPDDIIVQDIEQFLAAISKQLLVNPVGLVD